MNSSIKANHSIEMQFGGDLVPENFTLEILNKVTLQKSLCILSKLSEYFCYHKLFEIELFYLKKVKKNLKALLKNFDKCFIVVFKREAVDKDKEFLSNIYLFYKLIKTIIEVKEKITIEIQPFKINEMSKEDVKILLVNKINKQIEIKNQLKEYFNMLVQDLNEKIICKELIEDMYIESINFSKNKKIIKEVEIKLLKLLEKKNQANKN